MLDFQTVSQTSLDYRRFRIRSVKGQDDFAMIGEIVTRRYRTKGGNIRESCGEEKEKKMI